MVLPFVVARIENEDGAILMGQHPDLQRMPYPLRWDMPGGKVNNNETPEEALKREIKEETGFDIQELKLIGVYHNFGDDPECTNTIPSLGLCYNAKISGDFQPTEMNDMHWVSPEELRTLKLTPWTAAWLADLIHLHLPKK